MPDAIAPMTTTSPSDTLDGALEAIHAYGPEWLGGLSSHGPMVVEALEHRGRADAIDGWIASYLERFEGPEPSRARIEPAAWANELGANRNVTDWTALFVGELDEAPWGEVVATWVPRLAPGLAAAATHGVLRTAHAARSLGRVERPARVRELAHGLGYWAARYEALPARPSGGEMPIERAWSVLPLLGPEGRQDLFISDRFSHLGGGFAEATGAAAIPIGVDDAVGEIVDLGARMLIANPQASIAFVHAVTAPSSLRMLAPLLDARAISTAIDAAWVTVAALWSAYGEHPPAGHVDDPATSWDDLLAQAIAMGDEHGVKMTVAACDESRAGGDDVLLRAATRSFIASGAA